jgi:kinetochor protein Mis14/NSL1
MRREADLLEEIAALKREVPAQAAENWKIALKTGLERDEEALRNASHVNNGRDVRLGIERGERQEEIEKTWERGVQGLERLKKDLPGTTARMERAKRAAEYALAEEKGKGTG